MLVVFIRTLLLYIIVIISMRIMGKRQIGQLQPFELAIAIMISELAAVPMQNTGIPLLNGIIPILTLLLAQVFISFLSLKSLSVRAFICGKPSILIENGKIMEEQLVNEMYTLNDLLEQLRIKSITNISDVEFAILETNGQLSVLPKSQKRPLNASDININTSYEGLAIDLIVDGKVIIKNLQKTKLTEEWLKAEMKKLGVSEIEDIFFASLDTDGNLYYQEKMKKSKIKKMR